jgi:hypothetical protein
MPQHAEKQPGQNWTPVEHHQASGEQRGDKKAVLATPDVYDDCRGDCEQDEMIEPPPARTGNREIHRQAKRAVKNVGRHVGHKRERPGKQQDMRRIRPDVEGIAGPELLREQAIVRIGCKIRLRVPGESELGSHPGIREVAAHEIPDRIIRQRRMQKISDLQTGNHNADRECKLEERISSVSGC